MAEEKKYFWLRLKRDFFKRHDIQIIEGMPNGKDYILFYLKLLCESVDHEGNLRFSDEIPYNEQMLSTITNTNIDIVRTAIKAFTELGMMDIMDDGTLYMNGVEKLIGSESYWAEKKREQRIKQKLLLDNVQCVQPLSNPCQGKSKSKSIEIEKDIDKSISKDILRSPTDVERVIEEWNNLPEPIKRVRGLSPTSDRYKMLKARIKEYGVDAVIEAVHKVGESDFLRRGSDKGWEIDFGWFVRPNNFPKVLEGNYSNKNHSANNSNAKSLMERLEEAKRREVGS